MMKYSQRSNHFWIEYNIRIMICCTDILFDANKMLLVRVQYCLEGYPRPCFSYDNCIFILPVPILTKKIRRRWAE